ncbi:MAG: hypothetical protein GY761_13025 [Hyphomicrobiales bacterium]|nr:hypothetical protein [Hyphomicrobiales bacterium]
MDRLAGKLVFTSGLGGKGGTRPLAATMAGFNAIAVECQPGKIDFCIRSGYLDIKVDNLDDVIEEINATKRKGQLLSVGLLGNAIDILEDLQSREILPDVLTNQTSLTVRFADICPDYGALHNGKTVNKAILNA